MRNLTASISLILALAAIAAAQGGSNLDKQCSAYSKAISSSIDGFARVRTNERERNGTKIFDTTLDKLGFSAGNIQVTNNQIFDGSTIKNPMLLLSSSFANADDAKVAYLAARVLVGTCSPRAQISKRKPSGLVEFASMLVKVGDDPVSVTVSVIELSPTKFATTMQISAPISIGIVMAEPPAPPVAPSTPQPTKPTAKRSRKR